MLSKSETYKIYKVYIIITVQNTVNILCTVLWTIFTYKKFLYAMKGACFEVSS